MSFIQSFQKMKKSEFQSQEDLLAIIIAELRELNKKLDRLYKNIPTVPCLDNAGVLKALCISERTAKLWRRNGLLPYSKVGRKIYYLIADIEDMIRRGKPSPGL